MIWEKNYYFPGVIIRNKCLIFSNTLWICQHDLVDFVFWSFVGMIWINYWFKKSIKINKQSIKVRIKKVNNKTELHPGQKVNKHKIKVFFLYTVIFIKYYAAIELPEVLHFVSLFNQTTFCCSSCLSIHSFLLLHLLIHFCPLWILFY